MPQQAGRGVAAANNMGANNARVNQAHPCEDGNKPGAKIVPAGTTKATPSLVPARAAAKDRTGWEPSSNFFPYPPSSVANSTTTMKLSEHKQQEAGEEEDPSVLKESELRTAG